MKVSGLVSKLGLEVLNAVPEDREIGGGYTSDLLSDVMGNAAAGSVLVTIQAHRNTVAVASLVGIVAILVCNARTVPDDMLAAAAAEGICVLRGPGSQFEYSGRLWNLVNGEARRQDGSMLPV